MYPTYPEKELSVIIFLLSRTPSNITYLAYLKILLHHAFDWAFTIHVKILLPLLNAVVQILNINTLMIESVLHIVQSEIHRFFAKDICTFHNAMVVCNLHGRPTGFAIIYLTTGLVIAIISMTNCKKKHQNNSNHDALLKIAQLLTNLKLVFLVFFHIPTIPCISCF